MKQLIAWTLLSLSSCSPIYNTRFECPVSKGVRCASVGEVLDLIVEREGESDLFVSDKNTARRLKEQERSSTPSESDPKSQDLILLQDEDGHFIMVEE